MPGSSLAVSITGVVDGRVYGAMAMMRKNKLIKSTIVIIFNMLIISAPSLLLRFIWLTLIAKIIFAFKNYFLLCFKMSNLFLQEFIIQFEFLYHLNRKSSTWSLSPKAYLSDSISLASMMQLNCSFLSLT